jgi:hypothetical protein
MEFYTPIEANGDTFCVSVFYGQDGTAHVNLNDMFREIGIHKSRIMDTIYQKINELNLEKDKDFIIKVGSDPLIHDPEYVTSLVTARDIAAATKDGELAVEFLTQVYAYQNHDTFKMLTYDLLNRAPAFNFNTFAQILAEQGWNDGEVDEEVLIKLLKRDRVITRAGRAVKGQEGLFLTMGGQTYITPHGLIQLSRKYMGLTIGESLGLLVDVLPFANRLLNDSLVCDTRMRRTLSEIEDGEYFNEGDEYENNIQREDS